MHFEGIHYHAEGSGPAAVLIHGLLGYSFSWRFNIPALAPHRTVYALDLPGTGDSRRDPSADVSLNGTAQTVLRFCDGLGLDSVDLIGSSHGATVALMVAGLAPGRVRRAVAAAPANPWSRFAAGRIRLFGSAAARVLAPPIYRCSRNWWNSRTLRRMYGDPGRIAPGTLEGYSRPTAVPGSMEHLLRVVRTWNADLARLPQVLPQVTAPVLLVWGDRDRAVDPASVRELARRLPAAETCTIPGAGHMPYEEVPEEFNRLALEFLLR